MGFVIFLGVLVFIVFHALGLYQSQKQGASRESFQEKARGLELLRPAIVSFLFYKIAKIFIFSAVLLLLIYLFFRFYMDFQIPASIFWWALTSIIALVYIGVFAAYKKTKYFLYPDKIIYKGGSLFSDFEKELKFKNVTHLRMLKPLIENKLFKTGYVKVDSAGAGATSILISSIAGAGSIYERIISLMKENGFKLTRQNLIQEEKPHKLAVFFEVCSYFFMTALVLYGLLAEPLLNEDLDLVGLFLRYRLLFAVAGILLFTGVLAYAIFKFIDLQKRSYKLYEDTITYSEGFLNKRKSIIPFENLADSEINQSIICKIFDLYNVKLSCQGSNQKVFFKNITNGRKLSDNIDKLLDKAQGLAGDSQEEKVKEDKLRFGERGKVLRLKPDREFSADFKMSPFRVWLPAIITSPFLIIFFPILVVVAIANAVKVNCNKFKIKKGSVAHTVDLFSKKTTEFQFDKVTGIIFKEGILDRWAKTCQTIFWSIGSSNNIRFSHIKKENNFKENILKKKGIVPGKIIYNLNSQFSFLAMLKANIYLMFIPLVIVAALFFLIPGIAVAAFFGLIAIYLIAGLYKSEYYKRSKLIFYEDYLHFQHGFFWRQDYFIFYDDIKDIETLKYPLSGLGRIKFNVAGESLDKTKNSEILWPNAFSVKYIDKIEKWDELIDIIFFFRPDAAKVKELISNPKLTSPEIAYGSRPSLAASLMGAFIGLAIVGAIAGVASFAVEAPGWVYGLILGLTAAVMFLVVVYVKSISYALQPYRIYKKSGIVFKKHISVTYNKIDFINFSQNAWNKLFRTGNITVNTVGSSRPEMVIKNIPDFRTFYKRLEQEYSR